MALTDKLTAIADAIRGKTGKTDEMTLDQMVTEIAGIQTGGGGDTTIEDGLMLKNLTEYTNSRITELPGYSMDHWLNPLSASFPNVTNLMPYTFMATGNLVKLELGKNISVPQFCFYSNKQFTTLILRSNTVCPLSGGTGAFTGTPFASGGTGGTVYVPSALIESYKTATNWSTLYAAGTCNFVAIEGSEYE